MKVKVKMSEWESGEMGFDSDDSDDYKERSDEIFQILINTGSLVIMGYDHQDEPIYRFTEKCKEVFPELYDMHQAEVNNTANELWQMGLISINFTETEMTVQISRDNFNNIRNHTGELTEEQLSFLHSLVVRRAMDD